MNKNSKTCLVVHNDYLIPGGETKMADVIADLMQDNGFEIIKYYQNNEQILNKSFIAKIILGLLSIYNPKTVLDINKILKENKIDFALVHNTSPLISNSIYAVLNKNKIPTYKYLHNYNLLCLMGLANKGALCEKCEKNIIVGVINKCYKNSFLYTILKYVALQVFNIFYRSKVSGYIAVSDFVKKQHEKLGIPEEKIYVLHNFSETVTMDFEVTSSNIHNPYLYIGRLSEEKGVMTLLKAFKKLPDLHLNIMGGGEIETELKNFVEQNNLRNVTFLGYKSGEEKEQIIKNAKAIIVPSEWNEPCPCTTSEAYSNAVPLIVSNKGGLPELVEETKTGFIFHAGHVDNLIEQIQKIENLTDEELLAMKRNCINIFKEKYTKEIYIKKLEDILKSTDI